MLTNVHVKNLALIEETEINFREGFNILTGETGAGKSIIIGSINYCLGAKADKEVIREGAENALAELTFNVSSPDILGLIKNMDIPAEEDGTMILTRRIMPGRSVFKVNGETVTARQIKELASLLIDIHGQHDHQSLLSEKRQKDMLDDFAGEELAKVILDLGKDYDLLKKTEEEIESFDMDEARRARDLALCEYEVNEIDNANLTEGEEEQLLKKHNLMNNGMKIKSNLTKSEQYLSGDDGVLSTMGYAVREMNQAAGLDEAAGTIASHLSDAEQVLLDLHREILDYMESLDFDDEDFTNVEERLDLIGRLSLKYGRTTKDIIEYGNKRREELIKLSEGESYLASLKKKREEILDSYLKKAEKAHKIREKEAKRLADDITESLKELNFLKVDFRIDVTEDKENIKRDGFDDISFMISLNAGEKLRPLSQVASGGELSRVMLAIKTVLAKRDNIETLIFDEIDTGISGVTAWQVAGKIGQLAENHQIICITHLPQIAAKADTHFMIEKHEKDGRTVTEIKEVSGDAHVDEIARLLGSENITDAVRANAVDLLKQAGKYGA
ncbi:MAG: DNA repair protein RecN [Lachnospiraceae bacterium]|nr:DNA repair protein RecN [Lachnospiraceae bacterium]